MENLLSIKIPLYYYALLFNSTLLVYWSDHLLDNKNSVLVQNSIRHSTIFKNKSFFVSIGLILLLINSWISFIYLELTTLLMGSFLVICLILYLFTHQKIRSFLIFEKEILIAVLYSISVCFVPFEIIIRTPGSDHLILECIFFWLLLGCCTLQNLLMIALVEAETDEIAGAKNITYRLGKKKMKRLILYFLYLQTGISMVTLIKFNDSHAILMIILFFFISVLQQLALYLRKTNEISNSYRLIGELAFWLPALMLFI